MGVNRSGVRLDPPNQLQRPGGSQIEEKILFWERDERSGEQISHYLGMKRLHHQR
jgi:hypothetical protein